MEIKTARNWYWWLWLSPILTLPTLRYFNDAYTFFNTGLFGSILPVLISGMWHLILLIPASNKSSNFVRWHGRIALLLAGIRTAIAIIFIYIDEDYGFLIAIPFIGIVWFAGTLFGQLQAVNGYCFLWRWFGKSDSTSSPLFSEKPVQEIDLSNNKDPDTMVEIIRFNSNPDQRRMALEELKKLGLVERMDGESEPISLYPKWMTE